MAPFYALMLVGNLNIFPPLFFITILVLYKHKDNFTRLIDGKEPKIKFKHSVIEEIMEASPAVSSESESPGKETTETNTPEAKEESVVTIEKTKTTRKKTTEIETTKKPKSTKATGKDE
nr:hypothetical protein [Legionella norrlandica]